MKCPHRTPEERDGINVLKYNKDQRIVEKKSELLSVCRTKCDDYEICEEAMEELLNVLNKNKK